MPANVSNLGISKPTFNSKSPLDAIFGISPTAQQRPITPEPMTTPQEPKTDENGNLDFFSTLMAVAPTAIGALVGGKMGAATGLAGTANFLGGQQMRKDALAKQEAQQAATAQENQISAYDAITKRIEAETKRNKATGTPSTPKYFQSGNLILRINPDGTQEELQIGKEKGQFIQTTDGKVLFGTGDGKLEEVYKPEITQTDKVDQTAVKRFNDKLASINDQLIKGNYDVNHATTQAQLAAQANGIEWTPTDEQVHKQVFARFQVPDRKRAFSQLSSPMQTEILKAETFVDAIDAVDRMLDNPVVEQNIGLIPGTLTELTARVNTESLEPELQRFYSELKNAFDLLVRNRTGAALSMGEEAFYNTLFGSVKGGKANLLQSIDVQRQSALGTVENAFSLGPVQYVEADPRRITNGTLREIILADPDGVPDAYIDEMDRRLNRGLILQ